MEGINEYLLDRPIADLKDESVREFDSFDYRCFAEDSDISPKFPDEKFYKARNETYLGRTCLRAFVAVLNGKIYKIFFGFMATEKHENIAFREDAFDDLSHKYGPPSETRRLDDFWKISIWDKDFGNVILETDEVVNWTNVIYTSSVLRQKRSVLSSFLRRGNR
jgi:hypothetical protein